MIQLKTIISIIFLVCLGQFSHLYAQGSEPIILSEPEDWKYEKIDFPLDFAPEIMYTGFEELRFAPGMFDMASPTYFTYVFVVSIDNKTRLNKKDIKRFLSSYYKGLCDAVAKSKNLPVDTSKIEITLKKSRKAKYKAKNYTVQVRFFDTFNSGEEVLLNMELEIIRNKKTKKTYVLALVSPKLQTAPIWQQLFKVRDNTRPKVKNRK